MPDPVGPAEVEAAFGAAVVGASDLADRLRAAFPVLVDLERDPGLATADDSVAMGAAGMMTWANSGVATVWRGQFLCAFAAATTPMLVLDGAPPVAMTRVAGADLFVHLSPVASGATYCYEIYVDGVALGKGDVAGYLPESNPRPDVVPGTLSGPFQVGSALYPGALTDYWVYANAGVDTAVAAPVMVWLDGCEVAGPFDVLERRVRLVTDNLVDRGRIPPLVHVLVDPSTPFGAVPGARPGQPDRAAMRSLQYDTVSGLLGRHLVEEVLPDVEHRYALRHDGYSRAVAGMSSGGAGAFSAAWFAPGEFARVQSALGSFTPMQPVPTDGIRGANVYADWVRRERRPIRVWLSDGARDVYLGGAHGVRPELAAAGSWPEANHRLAAALRDGGYDICFRFGTAGHNTAQEALDLPESLTWLWRGYDPARVDDAFLPG
jgi:enterochelin esterase family protein